MHIIMVSQTLQRVKNTHEVPENRFAGETDIISEKKIICMCPQCGTGGHSIVAIYLRENSLQECEGSVSLSGAGIGTGSIGIGLGSGAIDFNGETHTRRALIFRMPERPEKESQESSVSLIGIMGGVVGLAIGLRVLMDMVDTDSLRMLFGVLPLLLTVLLFPRIFFHNDREQNAIEHRYRMSLAKYRKQMELYNSIRYCEQCNVLFENSHNICTMASPDGFREIMRKA